jgi:glucose/arabinose dehydrogenase
VGLDGYSHPTYVTSDPSDPYRLFVTEKAGMVKVTTPAGTSPYLDLTGESSDDGERGLHSIAFPDDFPATRLFYVAYTANGGALTLDEYREQATPAETEATRRMVLSIADDPMTSNHNGGQLQFGPDGMLYIGLGDGGGSGDSLRSGQDLGTKLAKILRIDPTGVPRVPRSNPFFGRRGAKAAVYSYGLRNPWRFSFDRKTGDLVIADVGQSRWEEIDFVRQGQGSGANFGWNAFEGSHRFDRGTKAPGHISPVIEHSHGAGFCSITGGYILRHRSYGGLRGTYVYGDLCEGIVRGARLAPGGASDRRRFSVRVPSLSSFGEDSRGRVYAASLGGPVYRLARK